MSVALVQKFSTTKELHVSVPLLEVCREACSKDTCSEVVGHARLEAGKESKHEESVGVLVFRDIQTVHNIPDEQEYQTMSMTGRDEAR